MSRGAHPEDARLFGPEAQRGLREAAFELDWLLTRGYPSAAALALVGNKHRLEERQRVALSRSCCSEQSALSRRSRELDPALLRGEEVAIDGFNLVIALEVALCGGPLLRGRDGALRDLAGLRGSYHLLPQTLEGLERLARVVSPLGPSSVRVLLDRPVSNSGRLAAALRERAERWSCPLEVELVEDPDPLLAAEKRAVVVSGDALVLDGAARWCNLAAWVLAQAIPEAWVLSLG